ncbi:MAG: phycobiliprotein lyase [Oscillatoria sp. PMC 1068.18]|nr:phycobiliprotein lyase [Oscillatoria sp. PMC 1076.18]MEC4987852.1 phycobiliprotein lyase [Oscillatoria sp. PMC 1068.18]
MKAPVQIAQLSTSESLAVNFFQESVGNWNSQRRYYTLKNGETQEVESFIRVSFLEPGSPELTKLAQLHKFEDETALVGGSQVTWESSYTGKNRKPSQGSTIFGVLGNVLYRDRGFATKNPITANFYFPNPRTMCLRTEYNGSLFEEELKLIGTQYRTRQTIISRAGEEVTIGQYLERRID